MAKNKLAYLFESSGLDWSNLTLELDQREQLVHSFPLSPRDFLAFAAADLDAAGIRGRVNAISNAKRAIDCRVESMVCAFGYVPDRLRKQLGSELSEMIERQSSQTSLPFSFKFLESVGVFTPQIVDRVRILRHDVEHRFRRPTKKGAVEALEIATLFVRSTETLTADFNVSFGFGSGAIAKDGFSTLEREFFFKLHCDDPTPHAEVTMWLRPIKRGAESPSATISPEHPSFYWLIRIGVAISQGLRIQPLVRGLISASGARVPITKVKITQ